MIRTRTDDRDEYYRRRMRLRLLAVLGILVIILAETVFGRHTNAARDYSGHTSFAYNGYQAPVAFSLAADGRSLRGFQYGNLGCFVHGYGSASAPDPFASSTAITTVGRVPRVGSLSFAVTGVVALSAADRRRTRTVTSVTVRFDGGRSATGTISFTQTRTGAAPTSCGPSSVDFNVRLG